MGLNKIVEIFFPNNKENVLDFSKVDTEKLFNINLKENELKTNLPYGGHLYVVDNEGYFRGFITMGGYKRYQDNPEFILDNQGRIMCWYEELEDSNDCRLWKKAPNKGIDFSKNGLLPLSESINYLLENTEQIKKPEYKIVK